MVNSNNRAIVLLVVKQLICQVFFMNIYFLGIIFRLHTHAHIFLEAILFSHRGSFVMVTKIGDFNENVFRMFCSI